MDRQRCSAQLVLHLTDVLLLFLSLLLTESFELLLDLSCWALRWMVPLLLLSLLIAAPHGRRMNKKTIKVRESSRITGDFIVGLNHHGFCVSSEWKGAWWRHCSVLRSLGTPRSESHCCVHLKVWNYYCSAGRACCDEDCGIRHILFSLFFLFSSCLVAFILLLCSYQQPERVKLISHLQCKTQWQMLLECAVGSLPLPSLHSCFSVRLSLLPALFKNHR